LIIEVQAMKTAANSKQEKSDHKMPKVSYAEKNDIPRGVGGVVHRGVRICQKNRISPYCYRESGIKTLLTALHRLMSEGKNAVLFGVWTGKPSHKFKFALYQQTQLTKRELRKMFDDYEKFENVPECAEFVASLRDQRDEPRRGKQDDLLDEVEQNLRPA